MNICHIKISRFDTAQEAKSHNNNQLHQLSLAYPIHDHVRAEPIVELLH